jgi:hypothetical protein
MKMRAVGWGAACLAAWLVAGSAQAEELYRCRGYSGGLFWSREHCQQRQALVDRIASVPSGLGFERQVELAEQGAREATRSPTRAAQVSRAEQEAVRRQARAAQRHRDRCDRLQRELDRIDSRSRQQVSARRLDRMQTRRREIQEELSRASC